MASVMEAVEVDVPVRTAYNQWTQCAGFPQFMERARSPFTRRTRKPSASPTLSAMPSGSASFCTVTRQRRSAPDSLRHATSSKTRRPEALVEWRAPSV
jgi:hypothetical protein